MGAGSRVIALLWAGIWIAAHALRSPHESPTEYQVKAAYLFNFLKFVDWPEDPTTNMNGRWVIGIVGENPFGDGLTQAVSGKIVQGRLLQVKVFQPRKICAPATSYSSADRKMKRLPAILTALRGSSVLTVGDVDHFHRIGRNDPVCKSRMAGCASQLTSARRPGTPESQLETVVARPIGHWNGAERDLLKCVGHANFRCDARSHGDHGQHLRCMCAAGIAFAELECTGSRNLRLEDLTRWRISWEPTAPRRWPSRIQIRSGHPSGAWRKASHTGCGYLRRGRPIPSPSITGGPSEDRLCRPNRKRSAASLPKPCADFSQDHF